MFLFVKMYIIFRNSLWLQQPNTGYKPSKGSPGQRGSETTYKYHYNHLSKTRLTFCYEKIEQSESCGVSAEHVVSTRAHTLDAESSSLPYDPCLLQLGCKVTGILFGIHVLFFNKTVCICSIFRFTIFFFF